MCRFLQFNCNSIQHCHTELKNFLHRQGVLVTCKQETKLCMNCSKSSQMSPSGTTTRSGGGGGLITLAHHSIPFGVPDGDILSNDTTAKVLAVEADFCAESLKLVIIYTSPRPPTFRTMPSISMPIWRTVDTGFVLGVFKHMILCSSPEQEMTGLAAATGEPWTR